jgi:hypothetical protein
MSNNHHSSVHHFYDLWYVSFCITGCWLQVEADKASRKGSSWPAQEEAAFGPRLPFDGQVTVILFVCCAQVEADKALCLGQSSSGIEHRSLAKCLNLILCWLQVEADKASRKGGSWPAEEEAAFRAKIVERYDNEGSPYFASARLWDDGGCKLPASNLFINPHAIPYWGSSTSWVDPWQQGAPRLMCVGGQPACKVLGQHKLLGE